MSAAFRASAVVRAAAARVPSIAFPVRRLPDGTRVSDLPAAEAKAFMAKAASSMEVTRTSKAAASSGGSGVTNFTGSRPRPAPIPFPRPDPPRRMMTKLEMETVMLGGAAP